MVGRCWVLVVLVRVLVCLSCVVVVCRLWLLVSILLMMCCSWVLLVKVVVMVVVLGFVLVLMIGSWVNFLGVRLVGFGDSLGVV